jgi:hypothetical protein
MHFFLSDRWSCRNRTQFFCGRKVKNFVIFVISKSLSRNKTVKICRTSSQFALIPPTFAQLKNILRLFPIKKSFNTLLGFQITIFLYKDVNISFTFEFSDNRVFHQTVMLKHRSLLPKEFRLLVGHLTDIR